MATRKRLVVVGNGMVGHELVARLIDRQASRDWEIVAFCEEPRLAYDRVHLSAFFDGKSADDLALASPDAYGRAGVTALPSERAVAIDRAAKTVTAASGLTFSYDKLVLATGSTPFVPPLEGRDAEGCFVYRTIDDLEAMRAHARQAGVKVGVVIGGGLLGLEAANALRLLDLEAHVVELAPRLMPLQLDELGAAMLKARVEALGVRVHVGVCTKAIATTGRPGGTRRARALTLEGGTELAADMVVFSAGIRPRDELARAAGLEVGPRGGIGIDDRCLTSDPDVYAIGECAVHAGRVYGLVAPGYQMARVVADELALPASSDAPARFGGFDLSTKLKLLGVDVASFGDAFATTPGARVASLTDPVASIYKKLVVAADGKTLIGGMLVGDAANYGELLQILQNKLALPRVDDLLVPPRAGGKPAGAGLDALPATATICSCHNVTKGALCTAIADGACTSVGALKSCTKAGTGCGSCVTLISDLLTRELKRAGVAVKKDICEHFPHSRQELYHLVRVRTLHSFQDVLAVAGRGHGCEICKPAVASILASAWNEHVLERKHLPLQDTNDRFLANIQRDGTYSVVPRVPGGEITPDQLITLGVVAKRYALYTKITGGQRVDLFGARLDDLPAIWSELIAAGFESGHAYGKALRTVKSCVGSTWCRYGVQDSVAFAIRVENRYKGLRAPHKIKAAVSGCARECAEAQSKDFGIIATEKGYNLYLGGNGGMKPQHAQLFATDLDEETLLRYVDRFLMFYIRTADRLQRTATWLNNLVGGLDYLRKVIVDDELGIAAELEAEMSRLVAGYECEWKATVEDPEKLRRFRSFVNTDAPDPAVVFVAERGQRRPARPEEKRAAVSR